MSLFVGVSGVDGIARSSEEQLLRDGWAARLAELGDSIGAEVDWDDAVANLDHRFNPVWTQANIGAFLTQSDGFEQVGVLDQSDAPIFAMDRGAVVRPDRLRPLLAAAAPLIAQVRAREAARGPFTTHGRQSRMVSTPIRANSVSVIGGRPYLMYVAVVQPDFGSMLPQHARAPIVFAAVTIDAGYLAPLAQRYQLGQARLAAAGSALRDGEASIDVRDAAGRPALAIRWRPQTPGAELLRRTGPVAGLALAVFLAILGVFFRITRRAYAELVENKARLKLALAASEDSNVAKSEFLASMSHEIRTPLNGVMGALHLLKGETLSSDGAVLLQTALASGEMVGALINDVLDLSKIEAGQMVVAAAPTDLAATIGSVADQFSAACEAKAIALSVSLDPALGWARVDPLRLRQCLFNLLGNAVKFTAEGGVRLEARLDQRADGPVLRVAVHDTGVGIAEEARGVLFERFRQADGSTTRRFGGSGLGLAITRQLAELMGGAVRFSSRLGVGSTFVLEIPAPAADPVDADVADRGCAAPLEGIAILVVDDNATNRLIASKMLEQLGAAVTTAEGGAQAIELARTSAFDLVLMDIQMPGMDGIEATRRLRLETPVGQATPIIALTANVFEEQRRVYLASGMDGVVGKPINPAVLLGEIHQAVARRDEPTMRDAS